MIRRALIVGLASLAAACGDATVVASLPVEPLGVTSQALGGATLTLFDRMVAAPYSTAFRGTRQVRLLRSGETYDYLEDIGADGLGRIAVEVPRVFQTPAGLEPAIALILLEQRGLFGYRVRDPRITDLALFAANWRVHVLGRDVDVAGHSCWRLDLRRVFPLAAVDVRFELDVEPRSGFVLAWREYDTAGALFSDVAFQTFEFDGDVSGMQLRDRAFPVVDLDPLQDLSAQVSASVAEPVLPPPGFILEDVEQITPQAGEDWIKFVYSDGFERVLYAHKLERTAAAPLTRTSRLDHVPYGPWTLAVGEVGGVRLITAGKVPGRYLDELVQSAIR